jgi:hypothetical protein
MSDYDNAKIFINKQTFEFEYVKDIVGMIMGGAVGLVTGNVINMGITNYTENDKYYKVESINDKYQTGPFTDTLSIYAPKSSSGVSNDSFQQAFQQAQMNYDNFSKVDDTMMDYLSEQYDINTSLIMMTYYLEYKIMRGASDDLCRMYAIIMYENPTYTNLKDEQRTKITELYKKFNKKTKSEIDIFTDKKTLVKLFRNVELDDTDLAGTNEREEAVKSLLSVKDLQSKTNTSPSKESEAELLVKKRTAYKALLKSHVDSNKMVTKWGEVPENIQQITITKVTPGVNPSVLSFGIYALTVGYGAILGAKYIGKLIN